MTSYALNYLDVDECKTKGICMPNSTCQNTPGSYSCKCKAGFKMQNRKCKGMTSSFNITLYNLIFIAQILKTYIEN